MTHSGHRHAYAVNSKRETLCSALQKELAFSASDFFRSSCIAGTRRGEPMNPSDQSSDAYHQSEIADEIDEAALAEVMRVTPLGTAVLAGTAVALLVLGYLAIYLMVFLPRGTVG